MKVQVAENDAIQQKEKNASNFSKLELLIN
jgi:hypothetical protein